MARVITEYKAYATYIDEPVTTRCHQTYVLKFTQANSDLTMDIADTAGTFWAEADDTTVGAAAKAALDQIILKADSRVSWSAPAFEDAKTKIAAGAALAATTEYKITTSSIVPSFLFYTAGAPTSVTLGLQVALKKDERGVRAGSI